MERCVRVLGAAGVLMLLALFSALAHGGAEPAGGFVWSAWVFTPDIVIATLTLVLVYAAGMARRAKSTEPLPSWRPISFFVGLAFVFLALQSPIDSVAEHLFFVHQVQHLLLRMVGPMLIALSSPQGILVAGLPAWVRRSLLAPLVSNGAVRGVFGAIAHPVVATAIFVSALYFWQLPQYHNIALLDAAIHYGMHATMLLAGLLFWWRIFDRRPSPQGLRYGIRLMMLWIIILSNITLGAYTTFKSAVLYTAYDVVGRVFAYAPLADEKLGGIIIWIPSSMMCLMAVLVVIHMWGRHETRLDERHIRRSPSNSAAAPYPTTASTLVKQQGPKNRTLALGFAVFVFIVFAGAILTGVLSRLSSSGPTALEANDGSVQRFSQTPLPSMTRSTTER